MIVDLRSDTVTRPSKGMYQAMINAPLGDDVFAEDPTVKQLEEKVAAMFGKQAGIYCPSGTMANQIAIKLHTNPMDEVICDRLSHIYNYENGAWAFHSGVSIRLVEAERGIMQPHHISDNILPRHDWYPRTKLVVAENTCNKGGGSFYKWDELVALSNTCKQNKLKFHLDGARVFNALTETPDINTQALGGLFNSLSICISKGLGAPVGSVLVGDGEDMARARFYRKAFGGGMRQAGILAAACIYALDNNISKLKEDHKRAKAIENCLKQQSYIADIEPVDTNLILFSLENGITGEQFVSKMKENNIITVPVDAKKVRLVTHLDFTDDMLNYTLNVLNALF